MKPTPIHALNRLALASALSLAAASAQAEGAYLSASIKLSNLSFQLIDLNPNDGIAPSLTIVNSAGLTVTPFDTYALGTGPDGTKTLVPLVNMTASGSPLVDFNTQSGGVSLASTNNSLSLKSVMNAGDVVATPAVVATNTYDYGQQLATYTSTTQNIGGGHDSALSLPGAVQPDWLQPAVYSAKLSANTALIITGQAAVDLHMDRSMLDAAYQQLLAGYEGTDIGNSINAAAVTRAAFTMSLSSSANQSNTGDGYGVAHDGYSSSAFNLNSEIYANPLDGGIQVYNPNTGVTTDQSGNTFDINQQKTFSLVSFNNTGLDADLSLDLQAQVTALQVASRYSSTVTYTDNPNYVPPPELPPLPTPDPSVPSIPEPSTYALMGLGLVGIVAARRQRRLAHQA